MTMTWQDIIDNEKEKPYYKSLKEEIILRNKSPYFSTLAGPKPFMRKMSFSV